MGLIKGGPVDSGTEQAQAETSSSRDPVELLKELNHTRPECRRQAVLALADFAEGVEGLLERLAIEDHLEVKEAILTTLLQIGSKQVVEGLIPFLRSEDAWLRNSTIEVLQEMPDAVGPYIELLMGDEDSDVRIFAINILGNLHHPMTPHWLEQVLELDDNVNVCTTAVDLLAEVGMPEQIGALESLAERFSDEPYVQFAVATAIKNIRCDA